MALKDLYASTPTRLLKNKRYATYQLHCNAASHALLPAEQLKICALECLSWLRARLKDFGELPEELTLPEPAAYKELTEGQLRSFKLNLGFDADATYIEGNVWAFSMIEPDHGSNLGTPTERKPVQGRLFETHIAFRAVGEELEMGFKVVCTQPVDCMEDCEVFRPLVVRNIAKNPLVGMKQGRVISESCGNVASSAELERLVELIHSPERALPVMVVTQAVKDTAVKPTAAITPIAAALGDSFGHFPAPSTALSLDGRLPTIAAPLPQSGKKPALKVEPEKKRREKSAPKAAVKAEMLPHIDTDYTARRLVGFTFVFLLDDCCFERFARALCPEAEKGDIVIFYSENVCETIPYTLGADLEAQAFKLSEELRLYPKRGSVDYGQVLFSQDARLYEIESKHELNESRDNTERLLRDEIRELRNKLREEAERRNDSSALSCEVRRLAKRERELETDGERLRLELAQLREEGERRLEQLGCLQSENALLSEKAEAASEFPTAAEQVKRWVEVNFAETVVLNKSAVAALLKYAQPNMPAICDGIYYLSRYALYRAGAIDKETLAFYARGYNWEVQPCGDEALRVCADRYRTTDENGVTHTLDLHIKNGVNPPHWVRIYFYLDGGRVVIGFLPDHLPTGRDKT